MTTRRLPNEAIKLLDKFPGRPITFINRLKQLVGEDPDNTKITECLEKCLQYALFKCTRAVSPTVEKDTVALFNILYKNAFFLVLHPALDAYVAKMHPETAIDNGLSAIDPNGLSAIDYFAEFRKEDSSFYFVIIIYIFQTIENLYQRYKFHTLAPDNMPIFRISPDMAVYEKARALIEHKGIDFDTSEKTIVLEHGETIKLITPPELLIHGLFYKNLNNFDKVPEQNLEREIYNKIRELMEAICETYLFRKNTWEQIETDYKDGINARLMFGVSNRMILEKIRAIHAFEEHFTTFPVEFGTKSIRIAFEMEYLRLAPYYFAYRAGKVYLFIIVFDQVGVIVGPAGLPVVGPTAVGLPAVGPAAVDMQQIISANFKKKRFRQTLRQIISDNTANSGSEDAMHEIDILDHILFINVRF